MNLPKEWTEIKLSNIASHRTIKNKDSKYTKTYTNSATQGIVRQTEYFDKEISNKENIAGYYLVEENDYVYNPRISAAAPCGPISKSHFKETGIMSPLYTVFRIISKDFKDDYLEQYFKSHFWHSYMKSVANYGARYDRMNITTEDFFNIPVPFPPLPEQEKIAKILSAQDKVIALKQKLLQEKHQQKKYLMQKLFSADGTSFMLDGVKINKSGWKKEKFLDVFVFLRNNTFSRSNMNNEIGKIHNIHYGDILVKFNNILDCSTEKIPFLSEDVQNYNGIEFLKDGDIIIADTAEDYTVGKAIELLNVENNRVVSGLHTIVCRAKKNQFAQKWLGYYINSYSFHSQLLPLITGTKVSAISRTSLLDTEIVIPSLPEQQIIAKVLSAADKEIELLQNSIEQEKQKKKALMQLLLTGIVRVKT